MTNSVQGPNESAQEFVFRLMSLREKVIVLAEQDNCPNDRKVTQKRFIHALSTGIRNNNILNDLRHILLKENISDEELLENVTQAVVYDGERKDKLSIKKKDVIVSKIETDSHKDNSLSKQFENLKARQSQDMSAFRAEIEELKKVIVNSSRPHLNRGGPPRRFTRPKGKCQTCLLANTECSHCYACGSRRYK